MCSNQQPEEQENSRFSHLRNVEFFTVYSGTMKYSYEETKMSYESFTEGDEEAGSLKANASSVEVSAENSEELAIDEGFITGSQLMCRALDQLPDEYKSPVSDNIVTGSELMLRALNQFSQHNSSAEDEPVIVPASIENVTPSDLMCRAFNQASKQSGISSSEVTKTSVSEEVAIDSMGTFEEMRTISQIELEQLLQPEEYNPPLLDNINTVTGSELMFRALSQISRNYSSAEEEPVEQVRVENVLTPSDLMCRALRQVSKHSGLGETSPIVGAERMGRRSLSQISKHYSSAEDETEQARIETVTPSDLMCRARSQVSKYSGDDEGITSVENVSRSDRMCRALSQLSTNHSDLSSRMQNVTPSELMFLARSQVPRQLENRAKSVETITGSELMFKSYTQLSEQRPKSETANYVDCSFSGSSSEKHKGFSAPKLRTITADELIYMALEQLPSIPTDSYGEGTSMRTTEFFPRRDTPRPSRSNSSKETSSTIRSHRERQMRMRRKREQQIERERRSSSSSSNSSAHSNESRTFRRKLRIRGMRRGDGSKATGSHVKSPPRREVHFNIEAAARNLISNAMNSRSANRITSSTSHDEATAAENISLSSSSTTKQIFSQTGPGIRVVRRQMSNTSTLNHREHHRRRPRPRLPLPGYFSSDYSSESTSQTGATCGSSICYNPRKPAK